MPARPELGDPLEEWLSAQPTADDRRVEALLADTHQPCSAHQLAWALEWTLERTAAALDHLQARLANSGQTLRHHGHRGILLTAREDLTCTWERARLHRHTSPAVDPATARVLHRALTARREERSWDSLGDDEHTAASNLISAGLIHQHGSALTLTERGAVTFGIVQHGWGLPITTLLDERTGGQNR